jgi:hypothetical protein
MRAFVEQNNKKATAFCMEDKVEYCAVISCKRFPGVSQSIRDSYTYTFAISVEEKFKRII